MEENTPGGMQLKWDRDAECLILADPVLPARLVWSLESGLLVSFKVGDEELFAPQEGAPFQVTVEVDTLPVFRGRFFSKNPFLPPALLAACEVGPDSVHLSFFYNTVVPLLDCSPSAVLRMTYSYHQDVGIACRAEVSIDGPPRDIDLRLSLALERSSERLLKKSDRDTIQTHRRDGLLHLEVQKRGEPASIAFSLGRTVRIPTSNSFGGWAWGCPSVLRNYGEVLLASRDLFGRRIAGYNVVEPHVNHYYLFDRDDVGAEMVAIACRFYRRFGDKQFLTLAKELAADLLTRQQPDGGLTFAVRANGYDVDYSDSDADGIDGLLALYECTGDKTYLDAAKRILVAMLRFQDPRGFFWGRLERPDTFLYPEQPWFTAYSAVAMQQMLPHVEDRVHVESRIDRAVEWLLEAQTPEGAWRYDRSGFYADYDDLTNTGVALWALARVDRSRGRRDYAESIVPGIDYLLQREVGLTGQFTGAFTPDVEKLVYDYKVGFALREVLAWLAALEDRNRLRRCRQAYIRYLRHKADIQGRYGMIRGMWGSVFDVNTGQYRLAYQWHEHESSWQHYAFFGWQGKLIELFLAPRLPRGLCEN